MQLMNLLKKREVIEKSQSEHNIPQPDLEHTQPHQPIEKNEGLIYDTELENTLKNMKNNTSPIQTYEDPEHGWMWNGYPNKILGGTEVEVNGKKYNVIPGIQNLLVNTSYNTIKSTNDKDRVVFRDMLQKIDYYNQKPTKGRLTGRDKDI